MPDFYKRFLEERETCKWGTYGKCQTLKLQYKPICELSNAHIEAILNDGYINKVVTMEYFHRKINEIFIEDNYG